MCDREREGADRQYGYRTSSAFHLCAVVAERHLKEGFVVLLVGPDLVGRHLPQALVVDGLVVEAQCARALETQLIFQRPARETSESNIAGRK